MNDDGALVLGEALREHRMRNGLTQRELADLAGVSVRTVGYIEQGRVRHPRQASLRQLTAILDSAHRRCAGTHQLRIDILGPLTVHRDDKPVEVGSAQQRCLLGLLALHANQIVSRAEIVEALWDDRPPPTYRTVLHGAVSRLRKILQAGDQDQVIANRQSGYALEIDPRLLDLLRFDDLAARARRAGDTAEALELFTGALACWRAPVLVDLPERLRRHPTAIAASHRRLSTVLAHADTAMSQGDHDQAAVHLHAVIHDESLHEGLHARLMLALAGTGQQAAALALFTRIRDRLRDELAVEPGEELRAAHLRVLRGEVPASAPIERNYLPRDLEDFTGRRDECRDLLDGRTARPITVIDGMAGVGKTTLAVHLAHELTPRYPDGQLFLDLQAHTAGQEPLSARDALESLLLQLGVAGDRIPERVDDRSALWRSVAAARRLLVVLDNVADVGQLRSLLPAGRHSRTLVTSRRRLTSLDGVHQLSLDVLPHAEAATLFARVLGRPVGGQDDAVDEVLRLCGFLPLAVRIAGAKARAHPSWPIAHLADRLRDQRRRLSELRVGDRSVRAAFALSYAQLDARQRRVFRLLGECPAHDFDAHTTATLAEIPPADAEVLLDELLDAHLLLEPAPGRFRFHDLVRRHACDVAQRDEPGESRTRAQTRLTDYYLHTAARAADLIEPTRSRRDLGAPAADVLPFLGRQEAAAWLATEHDNLVAVVAAASARDLWNRCWLLAQCLWRFFRETPDSSGQAHTRIGLGDTYLHGGDIGAGRALFALTLTRQTRDQGSEGLALISLGFVLHEAGRPLLEQALELTHATDDRWSECLALTGLGIRDHNAGAAGAALGWLRQAEALARETDNRWGLRLALSALGRVLFEQGLHDDAVTAHEEALTLARALCNQRLAWEALGDLSVAVGARLPVDHAVRDGVGVLAGEVAVEVRHQ